MPALLRVIGAEHYELTRFPTKVCFTPKPGGFVTTFDGPVRISAKQVLGANIKTARIYDVVVDVGFLQLSLASLNKEMYPRVLREGETLQIVQ
jgi:hypothetical protein